jgi:hypothetical protein
MAYPEACAAWAILYACHRVSKESFHLPPTMRPGLLSSAKESVDVPRIRPPIVSVRQRLRDTNRPAVNALIVNLFPYCV